MPLTSRLAHIHDKVYGNAINRMEHTGLQRICWRVVDNPIFEAQVSSSSHHHVFKGGLYVHTAEVLVSALHMVSRFTSWNYDVLTTAAICHDICKIYEYETKVVESVVCPSAVENTIVRTPYRRRIGHVAGSYAWWLDEYLAARGDHWPDDQIALDVGHCILSHHGRQEWGSPVEPDTVEAYCLHYADMLSSRFGATSLDDEPIKLELPA